MRRLLVVILAFTFAACSSSESAVTSPNFNAKTLDGTSVELRELHATRPVAMWFWAPTCSTCNSQAPIVSDVSQKYSDTITFLGIAWNGTDDMMNEFVDRHALDFPTVADGNGSIYAQFEIPVQPAWVFVNSDGSSKTHRGAIDEVALVQILEEME